MRQDHFLHMERCVGPLGTFANELSYRDTTLQASTPHTPFLHLTVPSLLPAKRLNSLTAMSNDKLSRERSQTQDFLASPFAFRFYFFFTFPPRNCCATSLRLRIYCRHQSRCVFYD